MKRSWVLIVVLGFAVLLGIAIIDAGAKRPIDWSKTYNLKEKKPFDLYVFREEINTMLGGNRSISEYGESAYELFERLDSTKSFDRSIVDIYSYVGYSDEDIESLLKYVEGGGQVFVSANYVGEELLDTLGVKVESLDYNNFMPSSENISYSLIGDTTILKLTRTNEFSVFSKLNAKTCTVLGYLNSKGKRLPNFIEISRGKGQIYMHLVPEVFSNYSLLQKPSYTYASKVLSVIERKAIVISDYYFNSDVSRTPLRVILTKPGLAQAWYLLLVAFLLLLIFRSKRQQRAVPIIKEEPNLSKDFAKTIATVYYENGDPGNIVFKKIDYFLFFIRSNFNMDTSDLLDERFVYQLSQKSGVEHAETNELINLIHRYRNKQHFSIDDVHVINQKIENFKSKANIL